MSGIFPSVKGSSMTTPQSANVSGMNVSLFGSRMKKINKDPFGIKKQTSQIRNMRKSIPSRPDFFGRNMKPQKIRSLLPGAFRESLDLESIMNKCLIETQFGPSGSPMSAAPIGGSHFPIQSDYKRQSKKKKISINEAVVQHLGYHNPHSRSEVDDNQNSVASQISKKQTRTHSNEITPKTLRSSYVKKASHSDNARSAKWSSRYMV